MESFLIVCLLVVLVIRWVYLRNRLYEIESRIGTLERLSVPPAAQPSLPPQPALPPQFTPPPQPAPPPRPQPLPSVAQPEHTVLRPAPAPAPVLTVPAPQRSSEEWEALVGGNWLNKLGVFVLVVGIALALGYSVAHMGPAGRVSIGLALSLAMLGSGASVERRERYRTFARGLLGGGWAALYFTVYAMQALDAARVIYNPWAGAILLLAVAVGMIVHALHYRSQTVAGLAYFIAFVTLAITEVTPLSVIALAPLAVSLLYVAHRFSWRTMALLGLVATYLTCASRGDTGAPLWQAQAIYCVYWLAFESFDILRADPWLFPLNALGFLSLSLTKWSVAAPQDMWQFLAAVAAAYLASTVLRARLHPEAKPLAGGWQGPVTLTAALVAGALFQKLEHQWLLVGLLTEAELFFLAGLRFRRKYLRQLAAALFAIELLHLWLLELFDVPRQQWIPVAAASAVVFYLNRALCAADVGYGYAAAGLLALLAGYETPERYRGAAWLALAAAPFFVGWWRRLMDFRIQAYLLAGLGVFGTALYQLSIAAGYAQPFAHPWISLVVAAAIGYAAVLCALWSAPDRFLQTERDALRLAASLAVTLATAAIAWQVLPGEYLGLGWMALALALLELGLRGLPIEFCGQAFAAAACGAVRVLYFDIPPIHNDGPLAPRLIPAGAALVAYAIAARTRKEEGGVARDAASVAGTAFLCLALWELLQPAVVAPAWALLAVGLLCIGLRGDLYWFRWQSYLLAVLAFARCWAANFAGAAAPVLAGAGVIACFYAAQFLTARPRLYYSLLATTLLAALLYYQVSGSLRTVAWGVEGVALLVSGFPLRDRVLRLSGLTLLLACILKLFVWDLRHLETLPRILSFLVLGLLLVAVSWIYTRFRERVQRYL
jgi:uncharacterized membrane protein